MGGLVIVTRPFTLLVGIIMARLLAPDDFGVLALSMVFLGSTNLFANLGMGPAIINSDLDRHKVAFHAFVITVISSLLLLTFTVTNAEWLAQILGDQTIAPVLRVLSLLIVFNSWETVPESFLKKDLQFDAIAKGNILALFVSSAASVSAAFLGFGIWSLVIGQLLNSLTLLVIVWWLAPGWDWLKPVRWDGKVARSLLNYGLQSTSTGLVNYFYSNWDEWLVGRRLGTEALGFYTKAYDFTDRTIRQLGLNVVGSVFFPTYTKIKDTPQRLLRAYLQSVQLISTIMFPIAIGFLSTATLLVPVVLGEKWLPMIPTFQVYSIMILSRPISANTSSVFSAIGAPKFNTQAGLVLSAVMVPMALLLLPYGIVGVAAAVVIGDFAGLAFNLYRINKTLPGAAKMTLRVSMPALGAAVGMGVVVSIAQYFLIESIGPNIWVLMIEIALGIVVYILGMVLFQREFGVELVRTAVTVIDPKGRLARYKSSHEKT
jgi:PST family polysaccharide transporter